ncbi:glycoside hydrolase family 26 protein [Nocardioides marmorisolisilvae]|nr:glycosyl hydrolase [Nocardioides marmorisolisilvae]
MSNPTLSRRTVLAGGAAVALGATQLFTAGAAEAVKIGMPGRCALGAYVKADLDVNPGISEPWSLEAVIDRTLRIGHNFQQWDTPYDGKVKDALARDIAAQRTPLLTWGAGPMSTVAATNAGDNDLKIRTQAQNLKALGKLTFLRFTWEMDLDTRGYYVDKPTYRSAMRRVYGLFQDEGATNVRFVFCPTWQAYKDGAADALSYYPGDDYVDWVGADGYARPWNSYATLPTMFGAFHDFGELHGKPMMIAETGVHHATGAVATPADWINRMASDLKNSLPGIRACLYFDTTGTDADKNNWRIEGHAQSGVAFKSVAADPYMQVEF